MLVENGISEIVKYKTLMKHILCVQRAHGFLEFLAKRCSPTELYILHPKQCPSGLEESSIIPHMFSLLIQSLQQFQMNKAWFF